MSRSAAPAWIDHAIWWQVYPLGATGAPIRPEPGTPPTEPGAPARLDRLEPWLDYAVELGANGLSLGPIFASSTHGYDTTDHLRIDPRLGDDAAFDRLAARYNPIVMEGAGSISELNLRDVDLVNLPMAR